MATAAKVEKVVSFGWLLVLAESSFPSFCILSNISARDSGNRSPCQHTSPLNVLENLTWDRWEARVFKRFHRCGDTLVSIDDTAVTPCLGLGTVSKGALVLGVKMEAVACWLVRLVANGPLSPLRAGD